MTAHRIRWSDYAPPELHHGAITIGNFDGVHRGHRELVRAAAQQAQRLQGPALAMTFDPPPVAVLNPAAVQPPLTTLDDRVQALRDAGAEHVVILQTDASLLALSPEAFFEDVLVRQLGVRAVVEGYNFRFGRSRDGTTATMRTLCESANIAFQEVAPLVVAGDVVSSSRVRSAIARGCVELAAELLGQFYTIHGRVVSGAKRGRTIGFPTANLTDVPTLLPAVGVYAVRASVGGRSYIAAANIGPNPTFGEDARKIEVHVLDFSGDLYDQTMRVEFSARLRETQPFASVDALVSQLQRDISATRAHFAQ